MLRIDVASQILPHRPWRAGNGAAKWSFAAAFGSAPLQLLPKYLKVDKCKVDKRQMSRFFGNLVIYTSRGCSREVHGAGKLEGGFLSNVQQIR